MTSEFRHAPVLLTETLEALQPRAGGIYIDATLGGGGHAEKVLELCSPDGLLLGIDADPTALRAAEARLARFGDRFRAVESYFDDLATVTDGTPFTRADGILFDLGVSSPQFDTGARGFSFQQDAPLDMRFGPRAGRTAADLVNTLSAADLQRIFQEYGEERFSRRIARAIVTHRARRPLSTTGELAELVARVMPRGRQERIHPATRVFQALRIAVNDELERLRRALPQTIEILRAGGRLAVISFHSLEDRAVKQFIRQEATACLCPPGTPVCVCGHHPTLKPITRRPIEASAAEIAENSRARSAKLRVAERLAA